MGYETPWFPWDSNRRILNFLLAEACGFILEQNRNILVEVEPGIAFRAGGVCAVQVAGPMPKCYFCWSLYYPDVFLLCQYVGGSVQLLIRMMDCSREFLLLETLFLFKKTAL